MSNTAIIGQGPSERCWTTALRELGNERAAIIACARLAIIGRCGEFLAELLGVAPEVFYRKVARMNLNSRWRGKTTAGADVFDEAEAVANMRRFMGTTITRAVLLGRNVARAFGVPDDTPFLSKVWIDGKTLLVFPHPSGLNHWWNDPICRLTAAEALTRFL